MKALAFFLGLLSILFTLIAIVGGIVQLRQPTVSVSAMIVGMLIYGGFAFAFYWGASKLYNKAQDNATKP